MATSSSSTYRHPANHFSHYTLRIAVSPEETEEAKLFTAENISGGAIKQWIDITIEAKAFEPLSGALCAKLIDDEECVTAICFLAIKKKKKGVPYHTRSIQRKLFAPLYW